jgi:hypothetical protein
VKLDYAPEQYIEQKYKFDPSEGFNNLDNLKQKESLAIKGGSKVLSGITQAKAGGAGEMQ